jgi:pilus assembly protein CpaE
MRDPALTSVVIAPNRELAEQLNSALQDAKCFEVLADLKSYPSDQTLELRVRQILPDVVFLDLATDFEVAAGLIRKLNASQPPVQVIGIHSSNDPQVLIQSLRAGACEFLHSPFSAETQREARARIARLKQPDGPSQQDYGKVVVFSSAKPGSGASTLATQTAFSLKRMTSKRVLLADFDVMGGSIAFALKLNAPYSLLDAIERSEHLDPALWSTLTVNTNGVDVLAAPDAASSDSIELSRLHDVLEYARMLYDYVVIDLPTIFHRLSLFALSEADQSFLVSTSELPSLHLGRRAISLLSQLGFEKDRYQMVVNRFGKKENITTADMEKVFGCKVFAVYPNDYYALHKVVTRAEPLPGDCELGQAVERVAERLAGLMQKEGRSPAMLEQKPALSES